MQQLFMDFHTERESKQQVQAEQQEGVAATQQEKMMWGQIVFVKVKV